MLPIPSKNNLLFASPRHISVWRGLTNKGKRSDFVKRDLSSFTLSPSRPGLSVDFRSVFSEPHFAP